MLATNQKTAGNDSVMYGTSSSIIVKRCKILCQVLREMQPFKGLKSEEFYGLKKE